jgi:hypothetical protein
MTGTISFVEQKSFFTCFLYSFAVFGMRRWIIAQELRYSANPVNNSFDGVTVAATLMETVQFIGIRRPSARLISDQTKRYG